ncbi:hypothetical protein QUB45_18915, partial [Microcoleus sp. ARI1-A3]
LPSSFFLLPSSFFLLPSSFNICYNLLTITPSNCQGYRDVEPCKDPLTAEIVQYARTLFTVRQVSIRI